MFSFCSDRRLPDSGRTEREQKHIKQEVSRSLKWAEMIKEERKFFGRGAKQRDKMVNRVYKGVPDSVRGQAWYILLDIGRIKKEQAGKYQVKIRKFNEAGLGVALSIRGICFWSMTRSPLKAMLAKK